MTDSEKPDPDAVRHPITGGPIFDPILRLAVKEGHYKIVRGKLRIHWPGLMESRRTYERIPTYTPLTQEQAEFLNQLSEDLFVSTSWISDRLGHTTVTPTVKFLTQKKVPIYRLSGKNVIFAGDIVRAIESCRIDMEADSGLWGRYLMHVAGRLDRKARRRRAAEAE